jgi:hypothetical protein
VKELNWGDVIYLQNEARILDVRGRSVRLYGSPMTPKYGNWAFQYGASEDVWKDVVPEMTDILITHGPAKGHLDSAPSNPSYLQGCPHLQREMWRVKPRLHVCGHIHAARGVEHADWGWLRWSYDTVCRGEGGVGVVLSMSVVWMWMWILHACGKERKGKMTSVNAAVVGDWGLAEGDESIIVEL